MKQELIDGIILLIKNLPEWGKRQKVTILLGMESFVSYLPTERIIRIKTVRCDFCGACCMELPPNSNFHPIVILFLLVLTMKVNVMFFIKIEMAHGNVVQNIINHIDVLAIRQKETHQNVV